MSESSEASDEKLTLPVKRRTASGLKLVNLSGTAATSSNNMQKLTERNLQMQIQTQHPGGPTGDDKKFLRSPDLMSAETTDFCSPMKTTSSGTVWHWSFCTSTRQWAISFGFFFWILQRMCATKRWYLYIFAEKKARTLPVRRPPTPCARRVPTVLLTVLPSHGRVRPPLDSLFYYPFLIIMKFFVNGFTSKIMCLTLQRRWRIIQLYGRNMVHAGVGFLKYLRNSPLGIARRSEWFALAIVRKSWSHSHRPPLLHLEWGTNRYLIL